MFRFRLAGLTPLVSVVTGHWQPACSPGPRCPSDQKGCTHLEGVVKVREVISSAVFQPFLEDALQM